MLGLLSTDLIFPCVCVQQEEEEVTAQVAGKIHLLLQTGERQLWKDTYRQASSGMVLGLTDGHSLSFLTNRLRPTAAGCYLLLRTGEQQVRKDSYMKASSSLVLWPHRMDILSIW
jgi:hypothetical protein